MASVILSQAAMNSDKTFKGSKDSDSDVQKSSTENFPGTDKNYKWQFVWSNTLAFIYLHSVAVYTVFLMFTTVKLFSVISMGALGVISIIGVTAGAHRLWAHKAYKARRPLRVFLMILQTIAFQNHIFEWCRDHRVHHKYTDTDADPHNATRGFFFSHIGWLIIKKHKLVKEKGRQIDLSDLQADPVVMFQKKYYGILMPVLAFLLPTLYFHHICGETLLHAWYLCVTRWILQVNGTWCVNSAAHIWGSKPYDVRIGPADNRFVEAIGMGEGFHNYHHVFPWDYKAAELTAYKMNWTLALIDFMAKIGQAYDLKTVPEEMIAKRALRTGDGSFVKKEDTRNLVQEYLATIDYRKEDLVWGWDDKDMTSDDKLGAKIDYNKV